MKEESKNWLMQAEADLKAAENSLKSRDYHVSVFLSQQTAEKCLKGIIVEKKNRLIKIHDLVNLGKEAGLSEDLLIKCEKLSKVYIDSRYGILDEIPAEKFNEKDALDFIKIAKEILEWCKKRI